jgi:isopentenyl-diphosphate Delta-isomerase
MFSVGPEMVIDSVDNRDRTVGRVRRRDVFSTGAGFRVVHDWIFNSRGELLLQRLARGTRHPGYWGSSAAAYLFSGETYAHAANRRLRQELGAACPLEYLGKTWMYDEGCQKFIAVFVGSDDGPFAFDRGHIDALEFFPLGAIRKLRARGRVGFTPTFIRVLDFHETGR